MLSNEDFITNLNKYKNEIATNNRRHKFYNYSRNYGDFVKNLMDEIIEVSKEIKNQHLNDIYYKKKLQSNSKVPIPVSDYKYDRNYKPEGAPTEFADIIIFILDYFVLNDIEIDVNFFQSEDEFSKMLSKIDDPSGTFREMKKRIDKHIFNSMEHFRKNEKEKLSKDLHAIIKLVILFCEKYNINIDEAVNQKIIFNNAREVNYRHIGSEPVERFDKTKRFRELIECRVEAFGTLSRKDFQDMGNQVDREEKENLRALKEARKEIEEEEK